jgi:hypothetical protein
MPERSSRTLLQAKHAQMIAARKFFLLFLFLLTTLVCYPYAEYGGASYYFLRFMGAAIILLSVYAVSFRRSLLLVAFCLAVPAFLQHTVLHDFDPGLLAISRIVLSFVFDVFIVVVIFRRVFSHDKPNAETVFGALCIYLLVGFSFTSVYAMLADFRPDAFYLDPATNLHQVPNRFDLIYYSFATMTSVGAAGITPVSGEARSLTVIESILGVLYLAVLIARLMGAYRSPEQAAHPPKDTAAHEPGKKPAT